MSKLQPKAPITPEEFASLGDEFLLAYALQTHLVVPVQLFLVGHAAELYLKAALLVLEPTIPASSRRHNIGAMLARIQNPPGSLLSSYKLREPVYRNYMDGKLVPLLETATPDYAHYVQNQELYWVSKHLADLKYIGTEHKSLPSTFGILAALANPYWIPFFRELREFLHWPGGNMWSDPIGDFLRNPPALTQPVTLAFLRALQAHPNSETTQGGCHEEDL